MKSRESAAHKVNEQTVSKIKRQKAVALASVNQLKRSSHELQKQVNTYDVISMIMFLKNIACSPECVHVCTSCDQLWYK